MQLLKDLLPQILMAIFTLLLTVVAGIVGWFIVDYIKKLRDAQTLAIAQLLKQIEEVSTRILEHEKDCNRVPKALVIERMENLCDKQDLQHGQVMATVEMMHKEMASQKVDLKEYITAVDKSHQDFRSLVTEKLLKV